MDRMQIYQHVLTAYANAQKGPKKVELPPSVDKIVSILAEVPDQNVVPIINLVVNCESEPKVLEAVHKLFKERGLAGKPAAAKGGKADESKELISSYGQSGE